MIYLLFIISSNNRTFLVGGLEHVLFSHILGIIIPTDELIFFRGVGIPPTRFVSRYKLDFTVDPEI
jgi:hypothetical protein